MKRGTLIGILGLLLSATTAQLAVAVEVTIEPASTVVGIGQPVSLDIRITDVVDLFFFEIDLSFDPAILTASGITNGLFVPNFTPGTINNTLGTLVGTGGSSFGSGVSGTGTLATVSFTALALGTSPVTLSFVQLADPADIPIAADIAGATVRVVPEPGTLVLLGTGLIVAIGWAWRRRTRK